MKLTALVVLVTALLGVELWQLATRTNSTFQKWEYIIESPRDEDFSRTINALGRDGWEVVFARRATSELGGKSTASYEMILKRPVQPVEATAGNQLPPLPTQR